MRLKLVSLLIILSGLSACSTTEKPTKNSDSINTSANALQNQATSADAIYKLALNRTGADKMRLFLSKAGRYLKTFVMSLSKPQV